MKKKARKLFLNRETLHSLELRGVGGGVYPSVAGCTDPGTRTCDGGTYSICLNTYENCSADYCTTGGTACG